MKLSRVEQIRQAARGKSPEGSKRIELTDLRAFARYLIAGDHPDKDLLPTQERFIFSPKRVKWYTGPAGSGKTFSLLGSFIIPAMLYPGSSWLICRATFWSLLETTLKDFEEEIVPRMGPNFIVDRIKEPVYRVWINTFPKSDGSPNEPSELIFHGLDDIGKLGSTKFNGIAIDEVSEFDAAMVDTLNLRIRRKLPGQEYPEGPFFLNMVSNPPPRTHWLHKRFCMEEDCDTVPMGEKFKPERKENEKNLPPGYYDQYNSMSPELRVRMIEGECGPDPSGERVFQDFAPNLHVGDLKMLPGGHMIRGWDFGRRRPAVVWAQRTSEGWVNRLACQLGHNEKLKSFAQKILNRSVIEFPGVKVWSDFVDPHGREKRDTAEMSSHDVLRSMGLNPQFRDTLVDTGIGFMQAGLTTLIQGRPRSMYDKGKCSLLIEGYQGGYAYANARPGRALKPEPVKDGFYEHLMDADRYIEVLLNMGALAENLSVRKSLRKVRNRLTGY